MTAQSKGVVWITRTRDGAGRTAQAVTARGFEPLIAPVLAVVPLTPAIPDGFDALVFTSGNAVKAFGALNGRRDLPVWCTGDATADRAKALGFTDVTSAHGDVRALFEQMRKQAPRSQRLLYAAPSEPAAPLAPWLRGDGFTVDQIAVYETRALSPDIAETDWPRISHVLIHSPRAGAAVAEALIDRSKHMNSSTLTFICISEAAWRAASDALAAAEAKNPPGLRLIPRISQFPVETSMLNLLG
jgi:uroporphyrinogen-III synthase